MKKLFLLPVLFLALLPVNAGEIKLASGGKALAGIVVPANAKPIIRFAARELKTHLDKMTGASFEITDSPHLPVNIYLGAAAAEDFEQDEFVISAKGDRIDIYGKDTDKEVYYFDFFHDNPDKGTLRGVFNFLDMLGVRWPMPGFDHVPQCRELTFPEKTVRYKPILPERTIKGGWDFMILYPDAKEYVSRVNDFYLWGMRNNVSTRRMVSGCHTERALKFDTHPERLKNPSSMRLNPQGKREPQFSCWSDPVNLELWKRAADTYFSGKTPAEGGFPGIKGYLGSPWPSTFMSPDEFMIDPMDHFSGNDGRCRCARCDELRKKYPCEDDSEIIWRLIAEVARFVEAKYPGKYISTLVYPPKTQMPKSVELPKNIRVRICISGAREMAFPETGNAEFAKVKMWADKLGGKNIPLWTYQCIAFAGTLPGVPDSYPRGIGAFLKKFSPYCAGMFIEQHVLTHTYRLLDLYIFLRMAWDPSRDVEKEITEFFQICFTPAAEEAQEFFARLERNWVKIDRLIKSDTAVLGVGGINKEVLQKKAWGEVYTSAEMAELDKMLKKIEEKCASKPRYAKNARLLRQYLYEVMKRERKDIMAVDDIRSSVRLVAGKDEKSAPFGVLVPAAKTGDKLTANGKFQVVCDGENLIIHSELEEPDLAASATVSDRKNGDSNIWQDNCFELFFYAPASKKQWQIIVNDKGVWSSASKGRIIMHWQQIPGVKVVSSHRNGIWYAAVTVPMKELKINNGQLRFNFCRERNIKGRKTEYSTWSPIATLGNWNSPDRYPDLILR